MAVAMGEEEGPEFSTEAREAEKLNMKERKVSWTRLRRVDSLHLEAGRVSMSHAHSSEVLFANFASVNVFLSAN